VESVKVTDEYGEAEFVVEAILRAMAAHISLYIYIDRERDR